MYFSVSEVVSRIPDNSKVRKFGFAGPAIAVALIVALGGCAAPRSPGKTFQPELTAPEKSARTARSSAMSRSDTDAITAYHNKVRRNVGVGPLTWSPTLAAYAQEWTDQLARKTCKMKHRTEHQYGENLYIGTLGYYSAVDAAKAWESEKSLYAGGVLTAESWHPAGHYTQMVWRKTHKIGCGESKCNGMLIVACNYDPPGNYLGQSPY